MGNLAFLADFFQISKGFGGSEAVGGGKSGWMEKKIDGKTRSKSKRSGKEMGDEGWENGRSGKRG